MVLDLVASGKINLNQLSQLNREGKITNLHVSWDLPLSNEQFMTPVFEYEKGDMDGKAESYKSRKFGADYVFLTMMT